jgi:hypothetical protein
VNGCAGKEALGKKEKGKGDFSVLVDEVAAGHLAFRNLSYRVAAGG